MSRAVAWDPPIVLSPTWRMLQQRRDGAIYDNDLLGLRVIISCAREMDNKRWVHLSVSHRRRLPKWRELIEVRNVFLGDVYAYQVLPPTVKYVNIHPNVLHLFHCLDENPMPDFTQGGRTL